MISQRESTQDLVVRPQRDVPHRIKWIILILLTLLLVAQLIWGNYYRFAEPSSTSVQDGQFVSRPWIPWLVLGLNLLLIAVVIWLMRVQRSLNCDLTEPDGCAAQQYDATTDATFIVVRGTASGSSFAGYSLALERAGIRLPITIEYPSGSPSGLAPVVNGELGRLRAETLQSGTQYRVILTVHGGGATRSDYSDFELGVRLVNIESIGRVPAQVVGAHPSDAGEPFKLVKLGDAPADPEVSVGGAHLNIYGSADVIGCGRQMNEWALEHRTVAPGAIPWQADAAGAWDPIRKLTIWDADPVHPREYIAWGVVHMPNFVFNAADLTRVWGDRRRHPGEALRRRHGLDRQSADRGSDHRPRRWPGRAR